MLVAEGIGVTKCGDTPEYGVNQELRIFNFYLLIQNYYIEVSSGAVKGSRDFIAMFTGRGC